jgi:hypothetical protein
LSFRTRFVAHGSLLPIDPPQGMAERHGLLFPEDV